MHVLAGNRTAHRGGMDSDFFRHFLDHHGFEQVNSMVQKFALAANDGLADLQYRLAALLNVLDELHGRLIALFHVGAHVLFDFRALVQELSICWTDPKLRQVLIIHQDKILVAMLHEGHVGLNQLGVDLVVTQSRFGIERADELVRSHHLFHGTRNRLGNLFVLLVDQKVQMPVDHLQGIFNDLIVFGVFAAIYVAGLLQMIELGQ